MSTSKAWSRKEWKRYAKDLETYIRNRFHPSTWKFTPEPEIEAEITPPPPTDDYAWSPRVILDLRALFLKNYNQHPNHLNLDPSTTAGILCRYPGIIPYSANRDIGPMRLFGMQLHNGDPDRLTWEMWI